MPRPVAPTTRLPPVPGSSLRRGRFVAMDRKMRQLLAGHLKPLVPADEVQPRVELLRVLVNGVVLASAGHPTKWPRKRQLALLDRALRLLGLA